MIKKKTSLIFYKNPPPYSTCSHQAKKRKIKLHSVIIDCVFKETMASMKVTCVVLLMSMLVINAPMSEAAVTCGQVTSFLIPCITYLQGGPGPSASCCGGVRSLNAAAQSTPDRKAACNCLKSAASSISKLNQNKAAALPGACGVNIPYKFSTSTNCATYVSKLTPYNLINMIYSFFMVVK